MLVHVASLGYRGNDNESKIIVFASKLLNFIEVDPIGKFAACQSGLPQFHWLSNSPFHYSIPVPCMHVYYCIATFGYEASLHFFPVHFKK